jgi:alpha-tubulin suppressor-like RCC1 family protein
MFPGIRLLLVAGAVALAMTLLPALFPTAATAATAVSWGSNEADQLGDGLGHAEQLYSDAPVAVGGLSEVTAVAEGGAFKLALESNGTVWAWGDNECAQLGDGHALPSGQCGEYEGWESAVPLPVCTAPEYPCPPERRLHEVVAIATDGGPSYALKSDGTVWAWGPGYGCRGCGSARPFAEPISGLSGVQQIAAGAGGPEGTAFALLASGNVVSWEPGHAPGSELPALSGVVAIAPYAALLGAGTVETWSPGGSPAAVPGLSEVAAVAGAGLALKRDGTVWQWGSFLTESFPSPTRVSLPASAVAVSEGPVDDFAALGDGRLMAWGSNRLRYDGSLGNGEIVGPEQCANNWGACSLTPVEVVGLAGNVGALAAGVAVGSAPGPTLLTFSNWTVGGSLEDRRLGQAATLSGSFNGTGALHGQAAGTLSFTATFAFAGLHLRVGMRAAISAAHPESATLEMTSLAVDGMTLPIKCHARETVAIGLREPRVITSGELQASGSFNLPEISCQAGGVFSNALLGFLLSALLAGEGNSYALVMRP